MAIVYRHIRLDNSETFYIGIGQNNRRAFHKTKRNNFWHKIVKKTKFQVEILFENLSWDEAQEKEKELIKHFGRKDLGLGTLVNLTDGGDLPVNLSEHSKNLIKEKRAKQVITKESNLKRSITLKGRISPNKGKKTSQETKQKIRESMKDRVFSDEHRKNLSNALRGNKNGIQNLKQYKKNKL